MVPVQKRVASSAFPANPFRSAVAPTVPKRKITKKCLLHGWLLNFPLDELSSNTPPMLGHSPQRDRKSLGRNHPTASQRLPRSPLPTPPMSHTVLTSQPRNQHPQHSAKFPTKNFQVFQRWTLLPRMRRHTQTAREHVPPNTLPVQSSVRQGS
jgi:hypothetical protein